MEERENNRKVYRGKVVSSKSNKTIVVEIATSKRDRLYGKRVKYSTKLAAHDENNEAKINDIVEIMETRPLSKTKRFRLTKVVEVAVVV